MAAETIGYLAPSIAGIAVFRTDLSPAALSVIVAAAACFEGAAAVGGRLMAAVVAVIGWHGVKRLGAPGSRREAPLVRLMQRVLP